MMKIHDIGSKMASLMLLLAITSSLWAQFEPYVGPQDAAGDPNNTRESYLTGNQVSMLFKNTSEISGWPAANAHMWPTGLDALKMTDGIALLVGARVYIENTGAIDTIPVTDSLIIQSDTSLHVLHYLQTSYREEMDTDIYGMVRYGFFPSSGYFNEDEEYAAMSNMPSSWPAEGWPSTEGPIGAHQWYGRAGINTINADVETYFVINDAQDQEYLGPEDQVRYYPRPGLAIGDLGENSTQVGAPWGGLGIRVAVRGYQWNSLLFRDIVFWEYELANISDYRLPEIIVGHWIDMGIGGDGEDDLGYSSESLEMTYSWDMNGVGSGGMPTGSVGVAYLGDSALSRIATSRLFPVASHSPNNSTRWFKNDGVMWDLMNTVAYEDAMNSINFIEVIATEKIELPQNRQISVNLGILHAYELLEGLNSATHDAPNLIALKGLAQQVVLNDYHTEGITGIEDDPEKPYDYGLMQNYPNPFNPSTTIRYSLPEVSDVSLIIYDMKGRVVQSYSERSQAAGWVNYEWSGTNMSGEPISTGVYLCRLEAGKYTRTIKMVYLK
ncbi:MAG: T9SS type A sorting domain-containing protein [FCB group bacterium]|nr:T9SS type A sorting domain-containing protein [FCB group bacterium]MBL7026787.1 T9SS type A sorting domain-containing protein [Candidatus Neomarinimicrobiota bacterium]MBL7121364.1 T9SS type A sorting domain-containing protein [Candidatus Neomarinimicrobiota bacterium]